MRISDGPPHRRHAQLPRTIVTHDVRVGVSPATANDPERRPTTNRFFCHLVRSCSCIGPPPTSRPRSTHLSFQIVKHEVCLARCLALTVLARNATSSPALLGVSLWHQELPADRKPTLD